MSEERPDEHGLNVARRWAAWHLGSPRWAEQIIGAYLHPEAADANLKAEMEPDPDPKPRA